MLEDAGIKLDSVVSDITGMSSTAMIEALIDGERRGGVLADLAGLLRMGRLPEAWIAPPEIRELRELTRYRHLCRHRHSLRYAEARIMPMPGLVARPVAVAGVETSA